MSVAADARLQGRRHRHQRLVFYENPDYAKDGWRY
jgi:hypothetical protein